MIDIDKLDRLTKLLAARETLGKFPTEFNDLAAVIQAEAKELGRELGANVDKTSPAAARMGELPQANPNERRA